MAASLTLMSVTAHALKYEWLHDGVGSGTADRTQAQMIADLVPGPNGPSPLKALLEGVTLDAVWNALDGSPDVSVYTNVNNLPAASGVAAEFATVLGPGRVLRVSGLNANAGRAVVEVRYINSLVR